MTQQHNQSDSLYVFLLAESSSVITDTYTCSYFPLYNFQNMCKISPHLVTDTKIKFSTYSAVSFFPPPRDGTNVLLSVNCCGAFLAGGLLMATDKVRSPISYPSIFSTACAALVYTYTVVQK